MKKFNKKTTLIFYADFGENKGKGEPVYFMAKILEKHKLLNNIIVRDFNKKYIKKFYGKLNSIPFGNIFPRAITFIVKLIYSDIAFSRYINDLIFDMIASLKLRESDFVLAPLGMVSLFRKAKKRNIKTILYSTGLHPEFTKNISKNNTKYRKKILDRFLKSIKLSDYIITQSEFSKKIYIEKKFPKNKIFVLPGAIDIKKFTLNEKINLNNKLIYLYVGSIYEAKGIKYLLKAWDSACLKNAELILLGDIDKSMKNDVVYYSKKHKNISFLGFQNPLNYYKKASVFVFPSLSEGMARVNLEAMAMGLPVITTKESGSPIKDKESGFIIQSKNSKHIKEKMIYFYKNKKEIKKMGENAQKIAQNYTWVNFSNNFYKIIKKIITSENS